MFVGVPGLKVALPGDRGRRQGADGDRDPRRQPGLLLPATLTLEPGEVPEGEYLVPFGKADVRRAGGDVTIVATGWTVGKALAAAE